MMVEESANDNSPSPSKTLLLMAFISGYALSEQKNRWQFHMAWALFCALLLGAMNLLLVSSGVPLPRKFYLSLIVEATAVSIMVYTAILERRTYLRMYANANESFFSKEVPGLSRAGIR